MNSVHVRDQKHELTPPRNRIVGRLGEGLASIIQIAAVLFPSKCPPYGAEWHCSRICCCSSSGMHRLIIWSAHCLNSAVFGSVESPAEAMYSLMVAIRVSSINDWSLLRLMADSSCSSGKVSLISNVVTVISLFSSLDK
ncbi:hypothetical protein V6N12_038690 [Hibiscus sabdariffa]|uniref:Uncharacterized protein n=1 Tax=Hibiscus sabdariffa TaxID=183260 RepID=A0ABR2CBE9_9ROSI